MFVCGPCAELNFALRFRAPGGLVDNPEVRRPFAIAALTDNIACTGFNSARQNPNLAFAQRTRQARVSAIVSVDYSTTRRFEGLLMRHVRVYYDPIWVIYEIPSGGE